MRVRTILAVAALAAPAAAFALGSGSTMKSSPYQSKMPKSAVPKFKKVDTNHNGKISWKEAKAVGVPKRLFKQNDFNHSGTLNKTEWQIVRIEMPAKKPSSPGAAD